jgi:predicted DNA-binding ribbon-helix-helix protein
MKSPVVKRSILLSGHKTSVSLEEAFWQGLKEIASGRNLSVSALISSVDARRAEGNLSSAIRLFVLDHFRALAQPASADALGAREVKGRDDGAIIREPYRTGGGVMPPALRRSA